MARYVYPAIFKAEQEGNFSVYFPDIEGCYTSGDDLKDAIFMAEDVLSFSLYCCEREGTEIPKVSGIDDVRRGEGEFVSYIACDTVEYAKQHNSRAVKKTLTIPEWLNDAAMNANINFSQTLQEALIAQLGIS